MFVDVAQLSRRDFLWRSAGGFGALALSWLMAPTAAGAEARPAKAKRVIQLFMNGGASQCDLFDYKPKLIELNGKAFDPGAGVAFNRATATGTAGNVLASPYAWKQHGE